MKASLNWMQQLSNADLKSIGREELLKKIGAQLGAVEETIDWGARYDRIVVARVLSSEQHPNADKLHVCMIDDGGVAQDVERNENGHVQVVCGAPNVREGLLVAWLPPGSTVPSSLDKEPFVLEARDLRGQMSNGMLASPQELGISDNHDGILEIGEDVNPGTPFRQLFDLDDFIIDCENKMFTHRPDCFGQLGVARELAGISGQKFTSPDWYLRPLENNRMSQLPFSSRNAIRTKVPRFMAQVVENVEIKSSPVWMQSVLSRVGSKSINNIVDFTNYYMLLTAQPTHAFDYDKIKALCEGGPTIYPRFAVDGEKLALLNGKTITLTKDDIVIATDRKAVALAGIMGGSETEVDENTKNIIIEAATFDMYTIRRSSMRHGLFTDAVTRFNKGQSPNQNSKVLAKIVNEICTSTGAQAGELVDIMATPDEARVHLEPVKVGIEFIKTRLGADIHADEVKILLENVEFTVETTKAEDDTEGGDVLKITPPFWRMDIELPEDIVEEIGRLYDYGRLPVALPARSAAASHKNESLEFKQKLRAQLAAAGANEVLTYNFVHGDLMRKMGTDPDKFAYHVRNALSPSLQYYRTSIVPNLLEKVQPNLRADTVRSDDNEFAIFEFGKVHIKGKLDSENLPAEAEHLAVVFAADDKTAKNKYAGAAFYQVKQYLLAVLDGMVEFEPVQSNDVPITAPYQIGRSAVMKRNGEVIGVIGEFKSSVKKALKLPEFCAGFELDLNVLRAQDKPKAYAPISTFPKTQQDITLEIPAETPFSNLYHVVSERLAQAKEEHGYQSVLVPRDIFQPEDADKKRVTLRIWMSHPSRTLKTQEATALLDAIAEIAAGTLTAVRI